MTMDAALAEKKTERLDCGLPDLGLSQMRVSPAAKAFILRKKPAHESIPDFAFRSMLIVCLLPDTIGLRLPDLNAAVVSLAGNSCQASAPVSAPREPEHDPVKSQDDNETLPTVRKPEQLRMRTAMVAVGKRSRA